MKKILRELLCLLFITIASVFLLKAQNTISYNDTFVTDVSYSSGNSQWDNWTSFRSSLDTTTNDFLKVTMKGTYDMSGHVCNDIKLVKQIALMLKNNSGNSVTCNGITWKSGTVGSGVEFSSDGTLNKCAKKGGYTLRPHMGSSRWGGINTGSCGNVSQRMMVIFEKVSKPYDAGISAINTILCSPLISIKVNNFGNVDIDSLQIGWSVNNTAQNLINYNKKLPSLSQVILNLTSSFNFKDNEFYLIKVWTIQANKKDPIALNDTSAVYFKYIAPPELPTTFDFTGCGAGSATLKAITKETLDLITWYSVNDGGNPLGIGK
ncbi:MAG: hypothetical protein ACKVQB_00205, partial [Bacteroidia bacterium]